MGAEHKRKRGQPDDSMGRDGRPGQRDKIANGRVEWFVSAGSWVDFE